MGTHIPDIIVKHHGQTDGNSSPVSKASIKDVLLELREVSKAMHETITASTIRTRNVDGIFKMLTQENDVDEENEADGEEEEEDHFSSDGEADSSESLSEEEELNSENLCHQAVTTSTVTILQLLCVAF